MRVLDAIAQIVEVFQNECECRFDKAELENIYVEMKEFHELPFRVKNTVMATRYLFEVILMPNADDGDTEHLRDKLERDLQTFTNLNHFDVETARRLGKDLVLFSEWLRKIVSKRPSNAYGPPFLRAFLKLYKVCDPLTPATLSSLVTEEFNRVIAPMLEIQSCVFVRYSLAERIRKMPTTEFGKLKYRG